MISKFHIYLFVLGVISLDMVNAWNYNVSSANGPDDWYLDDEACNGTSQSPIDIITADVVRDDDLEPFVFNNFDVTNGISMSIEHTGTSAQLSIEGEVLSIEGGGLPESYTFTQLHFHWGSSDSLGSEHTVNGVHYPMEMHFAFYASSYSGIEEAHDQPEGVGAVGFFFEISDDDNEDLEEVIIAVNNLTDVGTNVTVTTFPLTQIFNAYLGSYYRYNGSLAYPPCEESAIWTVFERAIPISSAQIDVFRAIPGEFGGVLTDNYRPVQSLNARTVSYYDDAEDSAAAPMTSLVVMSIAALIATLV